jgi:hypothetical protein
MTIFPGMNICNALNPLKVQGSIALGVIGGFVYQAGQPLLLTCYHCVMNENGLQYDHFVADGINNLVQGLNPSTSKLEPLGRIILAKMNSQTDMAIILPDPGHQISEQIPGIGQITDMASLTPADEFTLPVKERGNSGLLAGKFAKPDGSLTVTYPPVDFSNTYTGLPVFTGDNGPLAFRGDSGSYIVNDVGQVVAMVAGVDVENNLTYGVAADYIQNNFGITFKKSQ